MSLHAGKNALNSRLFAAFAKTSDFLKFDRQNALQPVANIILYAGCLGQTDLENANSARFPALDDVVAELPHHTIENVTEKGEISLTRTAACGSISKSPPSKGDGRNLEN